MVMVFILAVMAGLFATGVWGIEAGIFAALGLYLLGSLFQQKRRLDALELQVQGLSSETVRFKQTAREQAVAQAEPASKPNLKVAPKAKPAAATLDDEIDDEPLELDIDFDGDPDFNQTPSQPPPNAKPQVARSSRSAVESTVLARLVEAIKGWFTSGNLIAKVGVIVLFFGVAFLLKYAAEHNMLPIELRLAAVSLGGIAMLVFGWRLRQRQVNYALVLQGGAVGVLYLTVFAALRLYDILPAGLAFGLLLIFVTLAALLALLQDSRALSVLASAGGFLAPVLTSTGEGSHVALFSYYLLLNTGIFAIAWFKAWRMLNLVGFGFTFVIGSLWGAQYYRPEFFATTEPFLVAFFLLYVAIAVLFALRQPPDLKGLVDGSLVFGVPLVAAGLQAALVKDFVYGLAFSALLLGGFYILLASVLFRRGGQPLRMLSESFLATGVVFATLAVPFAFDGQITAAFWSLEGAAILWVGMRQSRLIPRLFGSLLQLLAGLFYLGDAYRASEAIPILNGLFLSTLLIACAGWFSSYYLDRVKERITGYEWLLAPLFFVWGFSWWLGGSIREIGDFSSGSNAWAWLLVLLALTGTMSELLRSRLDWPRLRYAALSLLPLLLLVALAMGLEQPHPLVGGAAIGWPLALAGHYWLLRHYDEYISSGLLRFWHAAAFWLIVYLLSAEAAWRLHQMIAGATIWPAIAWGVIPLSLVMSVLVFGQRLLWPVQRFHTLYSTLVLAPVVFYLLAWGLFVNFSSPGDPRPLVYLPILNPLDLAILFSLLVCIKWWRHAGNWLIEKGVTWLHYFSLLGVSLFLWLNGMLARTVHHWGGVPFQVQAMFDSQAFQASISVLWALLGLGGMLLGSWKKRRFIWLLGAGLMGLVVAKLFLVDLSNTNTVARIISFIAVGLLLLIVGYFSPAPPRENKQEGEA